MYTMRFRFGIANRGFKRLFLCCPIVGSRADPGGSHSTLFHSVQPPSSDHSYRRICCFQELKWHHRLTWVACGFVASLLVAAWGSTHGRHLYSSQVGVRVGVARVVSMVGVQVPK